MPRGRDVRPAKWTKVIELYDDGDYSAIWGCFEGGRSRRLGVRWNGKGDHVGYPSQGGNSLWYAEPNFLVIPILFKLLEVVSSDSNEEKTTFNKNINIAISEACARQGEKQ